MLKTSTKTKLGAKAIRHTAKHPGLLRVVPPAARAGWKLAKPLAKRRARKRAARVGDTARGIAVAVTTYAPGLARVVASVAAPKRERPAPRIGARAVLASGVVLGAAAVYLLEPRGGREHRRQLRSLVK